MKTLFILLLCSLIPTSAEAETIALKIGKQTVHAEIANTPEALKRGLIQRTELCADCGMLFMFQFPNQNGFWMKNTPLPLSIAFIAPNGSIINIAEMIPFSSTLHFPEREALYALEMNSGWSLKHGIKPGDNVVRIHTAR